MRVLNDDCIDRFGGKAFWLSMLKGHVNVPKFTALGFSSHDDFLAHPKEILRLKFPCSSKRNFTVMR